MHKIIISGIIILFGLSASLCLAEDIKKEDKNKDGKPDMWVYYDDNKKLVKMESDRNYDGNIDFWVSYGEKGQRRTEIDLNFDAKPDMHSYYQDGQRVKLEVDIDYDGKLDQINDYNKNGGLIKMQKADKNGRLVTVFDMTDRYLSQQKNSQNHKTYTKPLGKSKALPKKQKAQ
jgi:hypothetical protein